MAQHYYKHELCNQRKTVNYGNVIDSLSEKQHESNIELFIYQGIE